MYGWGGGQGGVSLVATHFHSDYLHGQGGDDGLGVDNGGVAQVVQAVLVKDLSTSLEPGGLLELDAGILLE